MIKFNFVLIVLLIFSVGQVYAEDYSCSGPKNEERGFPEAIEVRVQPLAIGGSVILEIDGKEVELGTVLDSTSLSKEGETKEAFEHTLGFIGAEDVSGVPSPELGSLTDISIYFGDSEYGEVNVYLLFEGTKQRGGTFLLAGRGTACLPQPMGSESDQH